ncbi:cysteine hydrolase family protein [Photobacterium galatheae]|uniref:Isochorismatase n=1 Tax=Photobacterium galatheae TaxID=1654360 RepID=A0A066RVM5_9GAMM|nr:cysteine hydrolase family protein [Photobacterium galatheae]KDM91722.1 isochorismatase [Photobacterium galatheae]MCM0149833.1 cysteine hydrolase [Photobacterium galatheae]
MKKAVLVIDVQRICFEPEPQPFEGDVVVSRINQLTAWAREKSLPVIFIQHEEPGTEIAYQTEGWQLHRALVTVEGDRYIRKTTPDSFLNTELKATLDQLRIEELVICGYATDFCVDTTTRRAACLGYGVALVSDAHTTHDKPYASGELIREHHTSVLSWAESFPKKIQAIATEALITG